MERDFNAFLKSLGNTAPVKSLTALRKWNTEHEKAGAIKYGQSVLDMSDAMDQRPSAPATRPTAPRTWS